MHKQTNTNTNTHAYDTMQNMQLMLSLVVNYSTIYSRNFHSAISACVCVSVCMCVREWLSPRDKDKYHICMRVFTCLYHEQQQGDQQERRDRQWEREHERTLSRSASISHSFFLSRTRAHTTVDRSAVAAAVDTVRLNCLCTIWKWFTLFIDLHAKLSSYCKLIYCRS